MSSTSKYERRILLLYLLIIFFVYKAITEMMEGNTDEFYFWSVFTILYSVSIGILYFLTSRNKKGLT